ncbi:MAG: hypothetical protein H6577_22365 [Lewinellaceae bacterium]|nr:hypothetical protein [Saprospiraceae bacterium]MCB9340880.1 hypothetical protein [Lewinellaceae bacterium]
MKDLIEKYFDGETSLEEEAQIVEYFNGGHVADELRQYAPLFHHFKREKQLAVSQDFDQKLFEKMEGKPARGIVRMRFWQSPALRIAAIGIMLLGAYLFFRPAATPHGQQAINWEKYEIKDEQVAYEETVKALRLVSSKLNKASQKTIQEVSKTELLGKYLN